MMNRVGLAIEIDLAVCMNARFPSPTSTFQFPTPNFPISIKTNADSGEPSPPFPGRAESDLRGRRGGASEGDLEIVFVNQETESDKLRKRIQEKFSKLPLSSCANCGITPKP